MSKYINILVNSSSIYKNYCLNNIYGFFKKTFVLDLRLRNLSFLLYNGDQTRVKNLKVSIRVLFLLPLFLFVFV